MHFETYVTSQGGTVNLIIRCGAYMQKTLVRMSNEVLLWLVNPNNSGLALGCIPVLVLQENGANPRTYLLTRLPPHPHQFGVKVNLPAQECYSGRLQISR